MLLIIPISCLCSICYIFGMRSTIGITKEIIIHFDCMASLDLWACSEITQEKDRSKGTIKRYINPCNFSHNDTINWSET